MDVPLAHLDYEVIETSEGAKKYRILFVFETEADYAKLFDENAGIPKKQAALIKQVLGSIIQKTKKGVRFPSEDILFTGVWMSMIAMDTASSRAHLQFRSQIIRKLSEFGVADMLEDGKDTIMVFNTERGRKLANSKSIFHIRRIYYDYLQHCDRLNLLQPSDMRIRYDSWENLGSLSPFHIQPLEQADAV